MDKDIKDIIKKFLYLPRELQTVETIYLARVLIGEEDSEKLQEQALIKLQNYVNQFEVDITV